MSQLRTSPTSVEIGSLETFSLGVDCALLLQTGETVNGGGSPSAFLYDDMDGGADVSATSLVGFPTVSGTVVTPILTALEVNHNYRLVVLIRPNATDERQCVTIIVCPE